MGNIFIIVHRPLRPHLMQKHTPTTPTPPHPQQPHNCTPPTPQFLPRTPRKRRKAFLQFLVLQQKVQSPGKPYPGTPEGRDNEKYTPPHQIQYEQPANMLGNVRGQKSFFKFFSKIRTDKILFISGGMLF